MLCRNSTGVNKNKRNEAKKAMREMNEDGFTEFKNCPME